ncbi:MAG: RHS repeat-associated core domain-containing protein [Staphylococcus sp.]|jgi:YD repeat protein|nr:RHS repeat-associated core domain-containing protein [Staphylococcus sp.]
MDDSKMNQTEIKYSNSIGEIKVNIKTGRMIYEYPLLELGGGNYRIVITLLYNSHYQKTDYEGRIIGNQKGWKLNLESYVFPYKATYNMEGFEEGDYVYIDEGWQTHRFIEYKETGEGKVYYDKSGSGLRLIVKSNQEFIIKDGNKNQLQFNKRGQLIRIVAGNNPNISKLITYDEEGKLKSIYDERKPLRKISFEYNEEGNLIKSWIENSNNAIICQYDTINNRLEKISINKEEGKKEKINIKYNSNSQIEYVINKESLEAVYIENSLDSKIKKIVEGVMKKETICKEGLAGQDVREGSYIGDGNYLSKQEEEVKGYNLIMPKEYHKAIYEFTYEDNYTSIKNKKGITLRYYFNIKGQTISVLEKEEFEGDLVIEESYRTLFKTKGWELTTNFFFENSINSNCAYEYKRAEFYAKQDKIREFAEIFQEDKYKYAKDFVISFWIKFKQDLISDASAEVVIEKIDFPKITNKKRLEKVLKDTWQYVRIPINLGDMPENIWTMKIQILGIDIDTTIEVADLRIEASNEKTININEKSLELVKSIMYVEKGKKHYEDITAEIFISEKDLFETYKNIYHKNRQGQEEFDLVYCNGTKVKSVSEVGLEIDYSECKLEVDEQGVPNYYISTVMPITNKINTISKTQIVYKNDEIENIQYYKVISEVGIISNNSNSFAKSSIVEAWYYEDGNLYKQIDEYGIVTENEYDHYGNLMQIKMYNNENPEKEIIKINYSYQEEDESQRENVIAYTENGITTYYQYEEPQMFLSYTTKGNCTTEFTYDSDKKITQIRYRNYPEGNVDSKNNIKYDNKGRIKSFSDQSGRTYGMICNCFGEAVKIYKNKNLILETEIIEEKNKLNSIIYKQYQEKNHPQITTNYYDFYGKLFKTVNDEKEIEYDYEHVSYSDNLSRVIRIKDPYEEKEYEYTYDDENNTVECHCKGIYPLDIKVVENERREYKIGINNIRYITVKDNEEEPKYLNPRIKRTKYEVDGTEYDEYNFEYCYDELGRLKRKQKKETENNIIAEIRQEREYKEGTGIINKIRYGVYVPIEVEKGKQEVKAEIIYESEYDEETGNIKKIKEEGQRYLENDLNNDELDKKEVEYEYDYQNQLIKETHTKNDNEISVIEYQYGKESGMVEKIIKDNVEIKQFIYNKDILTNIKENDKIYQIEYDNYGNIINDGKGTLEYDERNQLKKYKYCIDEGQFCYQYENEYYYNYQGVRYKKKVSHSIRYGNNEEKVYEYFKIYYLDGNRIIKEEWRNLENQITNEILYYYDLEGLVGIEYQGKKYDIVKDILGNVSKIMYKSRIIGEYEYDGWGKCVEKELSPEKNTNIDFFVLHNNPFRYRGYYYDVETQLFLVSSRYYSPELCRWISPDDIEYLDPESVNGLNLYCYCFNNPVSYKQRPVSSGGSIADSALSGTLGGGFMPIINSSSGGSSIFNSVLANGSFRNGLFFGKGTVTGLYASGHARAQISLKNGKFVLGAFGKFSLLNATGQIGIGNDDFSVSLVGVGDIGTVSAMAGILIDPSKNTYFAGIEAKAAVFTARGGVQFEIFDTQIEVGGSVSALSAGFQFGVGIKDGEFYYKSGFAVLFGYDFYIRIKFA